MIGRDGWIQIIAATVLAACLALSAALATALTAEAGRAQLTYTDQATEGDPPEVALGIAMGAFRGLFVNFLWIRANNLKEDGKFYEAMELSSAITRLQPRFPRVWGFHAWNMSYNISVATNTAWERWQWVNAGINLLRRQGIPRNPNEILLYRELAWIFIHKVQGFADDANHHYKRELAKEWTIVLGQPPVRDGSTEQNMTAMVEFLRPIAQAPATLEGVIEQELAAQAARGVPVPEGGQRISQVRRLVDRVRTEARLELDMSFLRFVEMRVSWLNAWYASEFGQDLPETDRNDVIDKLMQDPELADAWPRLLAFVRRQVLLNDYNMQPDRMLRYTQKYGPLDWRHPASHSLYWAVTGVEENLQRLGTTQFDTLNTDRIVMHSIQELFRFGQIQFDLLTNEYFALTNFDWVDAYGNVLEEVIPRGGLATDTKERTFTLYGAGYENFLKDVFRTYWNRGDIASARRIHERLARWEGLNVNDPQLREDLSLPLEEFANTIIRDRISTPHVAVGEIEGALIEAFLRGLGQNRPDIFKREIEYAQRVRNGYLEAQSIVTNTDPEAVRMQQYVQRTFADIAASVLSRLLAGGGFGQFNLGPYQASQIFRKTPVTLQRLVYDDLARGVPARNPGLGESGFRQLFPEPPGMAEFRAELEGMELDSDRARRRQIEFQKQ